jgi:hypothetical protein
LKQAKPTRPTVQALESKPVNPAPQIIICHSKPVEVRSCSTVVLPEQPRSARGDEGPKRPDDGGSCTGPATKTPLPTDVRPQQRTPLTLQGLIDAWGQTNSPYDFTGDGNVNVDDLLFFINNWPQQPPTIQPEDVNPANSIELAEPDETVIHTIDVPPPNTMQLAEPASDPDTKGAARGKQDALTLKGLINAWGRAGDSPYDFNHDGAIDVDDLLHFINNWPQPANHMSVAEDGPGTAMTQSSTNRQSLAGVNTLADLLIDRLVAAGFDSQPPGNLRELVDSLQLSPRQTNRILDRLAKKYPHGLGVNMVG